MGAHIRQIVIVGGGTAGWLTASLLAARHDVKDPQGLRVILIESPDLATIGVGEGTWPTIRNTLKRIGIAEADFLKSCDASFKQGSRFDGWVSGSVHDSYLHPFVAPISGAPNDIYAAWRRLSQDQAFADVVCVQGAICAQDLAPRQDGMPDYEGVANYAYHLDAIKFAALLTSHATQTLGVVHIKDHVTHIKNAANGDIAAVETRHNGAVQGDLFIDCTGLQSLLLAQHYGIGFIDQSSVLFNNRALAAQVAVDPHSPIASQTLSTAHDTGWIWDIALPNRRGIGLVYASAYAERGQVEETLERYIREKCSAVDIGSLSFREIAFQSGYRQKFWHQNCVAIGLSAGFLEPLEASAIVMIELAAKFLTDNLPHDRAGMDFIGCRFNQLFKYRWERIIDFLKLHYVLSKREEAYWQDNRHLESIPQRLSELLALWRHQSPSQDDFPHIDEIFPAASYQYVLYGMGFETKTRPSLRMLNANELERSFLNIKNLKRKLVAGLPSNRVLLSNLHAQTTSRLHDRESS